MLQLQAILKHKHALLLAIILLIGVRVLTYTLGFSSVAGDDYSRTLLAAAWADAPYLFEDSSVAWLPGHFYLLGSALKIHYDLSLTPRIVSLLFAALSLTMLYLITSRFFNRGAALITIVLVGLLPVHVYLSLTAAVDIIYVAVLLSFLYSILLWQDGNAPRHLILSASLLAYMMLLRYESWFIGITFCLYLAIRWLRAAPRTRLPPFTSIVAVLIVSIPPLSWLSWNYFRWDNPFAFKSVFTGTAFVGPITELIPLAGYSELILKYSGFIGILALGGLILTRRQPIAGLALYLILALTPFIVLTLLKPDVGSAYPPRYILQYLLPLAPFAAYLIWFASTADENTTFPRWAIAGNELLLVMSLYNLWLVYLLLAHTWLPLLLGLTLAGIALAISILPYKQWLTLCLSLAPLVLIAALYKTGTLKDKDLYSSAYLLLLALFYGYYIFRNLGRNNDTLPVLQQWRKAGIGFFTVIFAFNLTVTFMEFPSHEPPGSIEAGTALRQMFDTGALAPNDNVLVEVEQKNYKILQFLSNHPGNIILDRPPASDMVITRADSEDNSFLVNPDQKPYRPTKTYTNYEAIDDMQSLSSPLDLNNFSAKTGTRLILLKDPELEQVIKHESRFKKIFSAGGYKFYLAEKIRTPIAEQ